MQNCRNHRITATYFEEIQPRSSTRVKQGKLRVSTGCSGRKTCHFLLALAITILCIVLFPHLATSETNKILEKAAQLQQKKVDRLEKGISRQERKITETKEKELLLYNELKKIDDQLMAQQKAILNSQKSLLRQEGFLQSKEIEVHLISEDKKKAEVHIKNRLHSFYQMGEIGIINTIFSASTLPELLNIKEYFHSLFQYDRQAIKQYKNKLALLDGARTEMLKGKEVLLTAIVETKQYEKDLISSRLERSKLLKQIQSEEGLYKQALAEMQRSAENLSETFEQYKKKIIIKAKKKKAQSAIKEQKRNFSHHFLSQKGKLPPPVDNGTIITHFGKSKGVFGVEINSSGIDIQVPNDSRVKAVYSGIIAFAGELPGYGNVVIVNHGMQYFTLASRLNTIHVHKGDIIKQGETIGVIKKEQRGLLQRGLHFEVRFGSTPEAPLQWLDKSLLSGDSAKL